MKRIQVASLGKRILSALIDASIAAGISCLLYFTAFTKVVANVQHFEQLDNTIRQEELASGLYLEDGNKVITYLDKNPESGEDQLKLIIEKTYTDYLYNKDEKFTSYWYNVHVLYLEDYQNLYDDDTFTPKDPLYKWNESKTNYEKTKSGQQDLYDNFYRVAFKNAVNYINQFNPIASINNTKAWANVRAIMYSTMIGTLIPYLIVPLCLKNGKSVGKLATHLVVLTDEGYEYKRWKLIIRYLAFYIIELFGGVATIGLTLILTSVTTLTSRKHRALHDYIAFSVVADEKYSVFFKNEEEERHYENLELSKNSID